MLIERVDIVFVLRYIVFKLDFHLVKNELVQHNKHSYIALNIVCILEHTCTYIIIVLIIIYVS